MIPVQMKMARVALGLTVKQAAEVAGVSHDTITRIEAGERLKPSTMAKVQAGLEAAGVEFIPENGGGAGVRLRKGAEGRAGEGAGEDPSPAAPEVAEPVLTKPSRRERPNAWGAPKAEEPKEG